MMRVSVLPIVTLSLCVGIVLAQRLSLPLLALVLVASAFFVFSFVLTRYRALSTVFFILSFVVLGSLLYKNYSYFKPQDIVHVGHFYRNQETSIEGVVVSDVQRRDFHKTKKLTCTLALRRLKTPWGWKEKQGKILVHVFGERDLAYGDVVRLTGKLYKAFDFDTDSRFSYKQFLKNQKITYMFSVKSAYPITILARERGSIVKRASIRLKKHWQSILGKHLTFNQFAVMNAILTGDRHQIPKHIKELFVKTGTAHVLAISGLHMGMVAFLVFFFLKLFRFNRKLRALITIIFLIFYAVLTGARPSVVRATIMVVVYLFGFLMEREADTFNSLCLAAFVILCFNPTSLFDIGFQLSFLSVLSIIFIYPVLSRQLSLLASKNVRLDRLFVQPVLFSLSIWIGIGVIIAYFFEIVTPVMIVANFVVVPCLTVVIALGFGLIITGALWPWVAGTFAVCLQVVLNTMVHAIYFLSQVPGAYFYTKDVSPAGVWIYYVFLAVVLLILSSMFEKKRFWLYNALKQRLSITWNPKDR